MFYQSISISSSMHNYFDNSLACNAPLTDNAIVEQINDNSNNDQEQESGTDDEEPKVEPPNQFYKYQ